MLGGKGNSIGSVLASILFVVLREGTRFLGLPTSIAAPLQQWIFGLLLILVTLFAQKGLFPEKTERWDISPSTPSSSTPGPQPIEELKIASK